VSRRTPERPPLDPAADEGLRPPFPSWLPDLAAALRSGADPATLPVPAAEAWLADVRRAEDPSGSGRDGRDVAELPPPGGQSAGLPAQAPGG